MKFFKKNPDMLLQLMPDNFNFGLVPNKQSLSRKGQSLIPDLGVVPPQSGHIGLKRFENDMMHTRKKSFGELRKGQNPLYKFQLNQPNPTVAKYTSNETLGLRQNNTPSDANKNKMSKLPHHYFKPNTAANRTLNEYQTPNFMANNIVKTVNKTVYKVRLHN